MRAVLKKSAEAVVPSKEEEEALIKLISNLTQKIEKAARIHRVKADLVVGGSVGKGTWLTGVHDLDLFFRFDFGKYCGRTDELSDITEKVLVKAFGKVERLHGSRDYFQLKVGNKLVEIIPVLKIDKVEDAKNITDSSPLHIGWVRQHLSKKKVSHVDLRLAKKFFKASRAYGAESFIKGFSGHVVEILTCHYGSFEKLVKAAKDWSAGTVIDVQKHYKSDNAALEALNEEKRKSPIIVIDPIEPSRNAAASLREKVFNRIVECSANFCKKPSVKYFEEKPMELEVLKKKAGKKKRLVAFEGKPEKGKIDVVGSKLLKQYESILNLFESNDFKVIESDWDWPKKGPALLFYYLDSKPLSKMKIIQGPPTYGSHENILAFKAKYKRRKVWRQGYNYYAEIPRKFTKIENILRLIKKDPDFANLKLLK